VLAHIFRDLSRLSGMKQLALLPLAAAAILAGSTTAANAASFPCLNRIACSFGGYELPVRGHAVPADTVTQLGVAAGTAADATQNGYTAVLLSYSWGAKHSITAGYAYSAKSVGGAPRFFWRQRSATVKGKLHWLGSATVGTTASVEIRWTGAGWVISLAGQTIGLDASLPGPSPSDAATIFYGAEKTSAASTLARVSVTGLSPSMNRDQIGFCAAPVSGGSGAVWTPPPAC
jgi:hypothetical protein